MSKWGTTNGVWGDVIVGLGYFLDKIKEGRILYLGNNDQIIQFLNCQPFITEVKKLPVIDEREWQKYWMYTVFNQTFKEDPNFKSYPEEPFIKAGMSKDSFKITHLTLEDSRITAPIYQWHGVKLPRDVKDWAKNVAKTLPKEFYLFQPYSFNSNSPTDHWQDWNALAHYITTRTNKKLVLVGHNWIPKMESLSSAMFDPKIISLYNQAPSMLHIFALARYATGTITTSNSLAHWCQIDDLPCMVICNRKSTRPNYIFRRVLEWPTLKFIEFEDDVDFAFNKVSEDVFGLSKFF
jgi:hypothetical protein